MLRICFRNRRHLLRCTFGRRSFSSGSSPSSSPWSSKKHRETASNLGNSHTVPLPVLHRQYNPGDLTPLPSSSISRKSVIVLSSTIVSATIVCVALLPSDEQGQEIDHKSSNPLYAGLERVIHKSSDSFNKVFRHIRQTGVAASVLWQSLSSLLSSANHEVRSGFELRVASLLADIAAANSQRREALVGAGGGAVVDWLLESVAVVKNGSGTQAESARALAYLIADPSLSSAVLGRPHAVPNLLRFIFSCQPQRAKKHARRSSFDLSDSLKGRSMLVAAIMDIVTSSCDSLETVSSKPSLPGNAETRDIAAALQVIEEGGIHLDESDGNSEDEDGGEGMKGIGIKILEGPTILGFSRTSSSMKLRSSDDSPVERSGHPNPQTPMLHNKHDPSPAQSNLTSAVVPGLWDDLHCEHVAVPFATWALANWAMASGMNRSHIQELDQDGHAIMTALMAPERSVKWHGSLVARLLLQDHNLPLSDSVSDWSSCLLSTASKASQHEDISLAEMALSAFLVSVERSHAAQEIVMEKGLKLMRDTAVKTTKHRQVQEVLAKALESICTGDLHLSLEEGQKWSGVLIRWIFRKDSSDSFRSAAIKILSRVLDDYGPSSVPISQGWLASMLSEVLATTKKAPGKGSNQPKTDKVKTQIDHSNIFSATQVANHLASAVVSLARNQLGPATDSVDTFPLADLLSLEPFSGPFKNLKKDSPRKVDAADSAFATLKGVKALTQVCAEDSLCQDKILKLGVLCLLRRFLLKDDYEKLAALEAYDASRINDGQEHALSTSGGSYSSDTNDPSSLRVPPAAHIRRHAARLLTVLSLRPEVQKIIVRDESWYKWLDECANGKIPGCTDLKLQSYARATLLNVSCIHRLSRDTKNSNGTDDGFPVNKNNCPLFDDMIFLINPQLPHWKCPGEIDKGVTIHGDKSLNTTNKDDDDNGSLTKGNHSSSIDAFNDSPNPESPLLDVVFIHGLRGGPYKTWRIAEDKYSTKSGLVEKIDEEAGKMGTFWPGEWLADDFPHARSYTLKYKTNLTQWSGATLPLQEVSSMLLEKLVAAGIGDRPVVFVTHSMGGLVVKQMLHKAKAENIDKLVDNTIGIVFYSCPHFGSKLADMPWRMGLVLRPAPTIGELRSGSSRLIELNDYIRSLYKKGMLDVLSFSETKVTPVVEGYGGWALRMEIVAIESAYPGFGELVVLESTDHINSCKPLSRSDPSYREVLEFLRKLKARYT